MPQRLRSHLLGSCKSLISISLYLTDRLSIRSALGITSYTAGIFGVIERFDVTMQVAILGLSLNLLGIAFAPIVTPHLSERFGRQAIYLVSLPVFSLFILGASFARSFAALAICRFFAGFFGGPCLVLIEGTFADIWSANTTVVYYSFLALAAFIGTACGKLRLGGSISWRAHSSYRTSNRRLYRRIRWLAMDSVDCSDPCSRCLSLRRRPTRYLSTRNSETPSQTQGHASEAHGCSKWSHPARHVSGNILRTLKDVSHRTYRHRFELRSRLHFWGHLSMVHCHPCGP